MPGATNWKNLYLEEYLQLREEGYPVGSGSAEQSDYIPIAAAEESARDDGEMWREAYDRLWAVREKGISPDYPYEEPDDVESIFADAPAVPILPDAKDPMDHLLGAWQGRCAGVVLGKPLEMGLDQDKIERYLRSIDAWPLNDWVPEFSPALQMRLREDCVPSCKGHVAFVQPDDDIHYTILALLLAERKGADFTAADAGENLLDNVPYHWLWCSSRQMYYHMVRLSETGELPAKLTELKMTCNPFRECIDGQISADMWGYLCPGNPRRAAVFAHRAASLSLVKNGLYGAMFTAACVSAALCAPQNIDAILNAGLSAIPRHSRLCEAVNFTRERFAVGESWRKVCRELYDRYGHLPFGGTVNNLSLTVLALLEGRMDYSRTITSAVMCGTDTDCNAGTAGSIIGAAAGARGIDPRWITPLNDRVYTAVAGYPSGSITDLARRTYKAREKMLCSRA